ncbi:hypothetical protein JW933_11600, partial [candidate division FCPU426 bacterium]|nr:hypothetical protein [candidate division FCPU426 bacterium]
MKNIPSNIPLSLAWWSAPQRKSLTRTVSMAIALTFLLPYLTFAFDPARYPVPDNSVQFNQQTVHLPDKYASTKSVFQGGAELVIHIQDLHCNYEAQSNIAAVIGQLAKEGLADLVAIEGASLPINVTPISTFPDDKVRLETGKYFMRQGMLSGAEFFAATGGQPVFITGIEKAELYEESRELLKEFLNDEIMGCLYDLKDLLYSLNDSLYTEPLKELEAHTLAFRQGKVNLHPYCLYLLQQAQQHRLAVDPYPQLLAYVANFQNRLPAGVEFEPLLDESQSLEQALRAQLYTDQGQKDLDAWKQRLEVMEKLLNISVTPEELAAFRADPAAFQVEPVLAFYRRCGGKDDIMPEANTLNEALAQVLRFYALADQRSRAFVENTLARMSEQRNHCAVLITGGFHTEKVLADLKNRNISYISLVPRISRADTSNPYFSLIRGLQTPWEKMLLENQNTFAKAPHLPQSPRPLSVLTPQEEKLLPEVAQMFMNLNRMVVQIIDVGLGLDESQGDISEAQAKCEQDSGTYPYANALPVDWDNAESAGDVFIVPFKGVRGGVVFEPNGDPYGLRAQQAGGLQMDFTPYEAVVLRQDVLEENRERLMGAGNRVKGIEVRDLLIHALSQTPVVAPAVLPMDIAYHQAGGQQISQAVEEVGAYVETARRRQEKTRMKARQERVASKLRLRPRSLRQSLLARVLAAVLLLAPVGGKV